MMIQTKVVVAGLVVPAVPEGGFPGVGRTGVVPPPPGVGGVGVGVGVAPPPPLGTVIETRPPPRRFIRVTRTETVRATKARGFRLRRVIPTDGVA